MKNKYHRTILQSVVLATALTSSVAYAGTAEETAPVAPAPVEDVISGVLKLDFNTHFISYGADVWSDGSSMSDPTFNPMVELAVALPADLTLTLGTWWDVNSKIDSAIGGRIQEVDVWTGLSYSIDKLTISATYQAWMYGSDTENILDVKFAYDTFLSPSLTIHQRLNQGAAVGDEGTILLVGLSHSIEAGPVTVSFPVNIAYFATEGFHQNAVAALPATPAVPPALGVPGNTAMPAVPAIAEADDGLGYLSIGVAAALPLNPYIGDAYGDWTLNGGLTYYFTDDGVIPNNPQDSFLTANLGLALSF
jgi:hypothetical protein